MATAIRCTEPTLAPVSRAAALIPLPAVSAARIAASVSARSFGRPMALPLLVPFTRARASPAFVLSMIMARSNSANTAIMPNMARPAGVDVSNPCWCR